MDLSMQEVVEQGANVVNERVANYFSELNALVANELFQDLQANRAEITTLLTEVCASRGHVSLLVADIRGNAYRMDGATLQIGDRDYFSKALQGQNVVSNPMISKSTGKLVIIFAAPIKDAANQVCGVLALTRDGDELSKIIADVTYGKNGKTFMLNKQGITVAHSNQELVVKMDNDFENIKKDPSLQQLVDVERRMVAGETGIGEYQYNGVIKYMAYCPVPETEWLLALTAPKSKVFASMDRMGTLIFLGRCFSWESAG
jgi:methyl-accepting chemotaxis protein